MSHSHGDGFKKRIPAGTRLRPFFRPFITMTYLVRKQLLYCERPGNVSVRCEERGVGEVGLVLFKSVRKQKRP